MNPSDLIFCTIQKSSQVRASSDVSSGIGTSVPVGVTGFSGILSFVWLWSGSIRLFMTIDRTTSLITARWGFRSNVIRHRLSRIMDVIIGRCHRH